MNPSEIISNKQNTIEARKTLEHLLHTTCCLLGPEQAAARTEFSKTREVFTIKGLQVLFDQGMQFLDKSNGDAFRATLRKLIDQL